MNTGSLFLYWGRGDIKRALGFLNIRVSIVFTSLYHPCAPNMLVTRLGTNADGRWLGMHDIPSANNENVLNTVWLLLWRGRGDIKRDLGFLNIRVSIVFTSLYHLCAPNMLVTRLGTNADGHSLGMHEIPSANNENVLNTVWLLLWRGRGGIKRDLGFLNIIVSIVLHHATILVHRTCLWHVWGQTLMEAN